jgi:hypothetical protein
MRSPLLQREHREALFAAVGYASAAYFGGRADVRTRKRNGQVRVVDFTSVYPTIFCLQCLDRLLTAPQIGANS